MSWVEVLGFVTGAACVWLAVREKVATFPVGIANNAVFVALFVPAGLYVNAGLQVVYLVLGVLGWRWWLRAGPDRGPLRPRSTPVAAWPWLVGAGVVTTALLWWLLTAATDSTVPGWDAATTSASLVAQVMLNRKWLQNWLVWIAVDVVYVGLFASQGLWLTALLYAGFTVLCLHGWRTWRAAQREPALVAA